ncbi:MAG: PQQ-like beta-propeller repeat protein [Candidatus Latescibacteria bacterium]|nr:PQQ-like beta-propeller repeat protein [Candidatus Latescibacterota bacterium]
MRKSLRYTIILLLCIIIGSLITAKSGFTYEFNNDFKPGAFPGKVRTRNFSITVNQQTLLVVYPSSVDSDAKNLQAILEKKCGMAIPFQNADSIEKNELQSHDLILIGNISNNKWALELYKRRYAFADAYFPGAGGVIIHPVQSIWNPDKNVLVIGVSRDEDVASGFETFVSLLSGNATTINTMHHLTTDLQFPKPPESVQSTLDQVRENLRTTMAPYWSIANWGLLYYLSGDTKWAEHFRDGMYLCYERAEKTGQWIPESWTNVYFNLWKMVMVWELIDNDPFFTPEDRKIFDEVLWGYTTFVRWLPNLDERFAKPGEPRQNHTTFLALSLYFSHRYFSQNYGIEGLDSMVEKYRRAFDYGQACSYRANDDAGNYLYYGPLHHLTYTMAEDDYSFCESGRLRTLIDLVAVTLDNRRDPVSFGDVGGYTHRAEGSARGRELKFFGMGAWYYGDSQYQWLYNWGAKERVISLDTMSEDKNGGKENPIQMHFGTDRVFSVEDMYSGIYAVDIGEKNPRRYVGVFPIMIDDASLQWNAKRSYDNGQIPASSERYFDKISYRWSFDPQDEYLLLDGLSTFSHGHHDGNTVTRLTWKDRIWLFDLDYIKLTPKYHNGVSVTRNGIQEPPPPLTVLDVAADFEKIGITQSTSREYNGADWERSIIWQKGKYFLFLDRIKALTNGNYRLDSRWRTRGEVALNEDQLTVKQGDVSFFIMSADGAERTLITEPDGSRSNWNYPYGNGETTICKAQKKMTMKPGDEWVYANLMYVSDNPARRPIQLFKAGDKLYAVDDAENRDLIGLDPGVLTDEGVFTDCKLFIQDSRYIWFIGATYLRFRNAYIEAPSDVHFEINYRNRTGKLVVPEGSTGEFRMRNLGFNNREFSGAEKKESVELGSGTYTFTFDFTFNGDFWKNRVPLLSLRPAAIRKSPEAQQNKYENFGIEKIHELPVFNDITVSCPVENHVLIGDKAGYVKEYDGNSIIEKFRLPSDRPVVCMYAEDIDGNGSYEIIAGDDRANLYCFSSQGEQLWHRTLTLFYGADANPVDITVGDIDRSGKKTILVANNGWKVYAFNPDGTIKWESFVYYHPLTKVRILDNGGNKIYIAAGTEYHTPLNVISPTDGKVIWHVWEEMGSEFISTTDYCGIHLTDMVFTDTDGDRDREIVFGTKSNSIFALEPKDGVTNWKANVGGEVTVMKLFPSTNNGEETILVGNDAGDMFMYNRRGERLSSIDIGNSISDIEIFEPQSDFGRDILSSTQDGRLLVCDSKFRIRASYNLEESTIIDIAAQNYKKNMSFYVITTKSVLLMEYQPHNQKKSRHY